MSILNIRQRNAHRYTAIKHAGDNEVIAAERLKHAASSTPNLQRFFESPRGQVVMLLTGLAIFAIFAPVGSF
jgi:hypothetical protein